MLDIMKFEFARERDGDFARREVAGIRYIHLCVIHAQFDACGAVVAESPNRSYHSYLSRFRIGHSLAYDGDATLVRGLNHFNISRVIFIDLTRVFDDVGTPEKY